MIYPALGCTSNYSKAVLWWYSSSQGHLTPSSSHNRHTIGWQNCSVGFRINTVPTSWCSQINDDRSTLHWSLERMRHEDSKICRARLLRKAFQCHMDWKQPLQQGKSWSPHLASCKAFGAAQRAGWWSLWLKNCHHPAFQSIFLKCLDFYQTLPSPQRIHLESKTSVLGWEFPASGTLGGSNTIPFDPSYTSQIPTNSQQVKRKKDTWHDFLSIGSPLTLDLCFWNFKEKIG